jgi:NCS2 family nucleobase:cation symporter-2
VGALVAVGLNLLLPGREFDAHEEELESATAAPVATSSAAA